MLRNSVPLFPLEAAEELYKEARNKIEYVVNYTVNENKKIPEIYPELSRIVKCEGFPPFYIYFKIVVDQENNEMHVLHIYQNVDEKTLNELKTSFFGNAENTLFYKATGDTFVIFKMNNKRLFNLIKEAIQNQPLI